MGLRQHPDGKPASDPQRIGTTAPTSSLLLFPRLVYTVLAGRAGRSGEQGLHATTTTTESEHKDQGRVLVHQTAGLKMTIGRNRSACRADEDSDGN